MKNFASTRDAIYAHFQGSAACQSYFHDPSCHDSYAAYRTSMNLLEDTTESLVAHRAQGFSLRPPQAYIEFWGVMQSLVTHQDAVTELYATVMDQPLQVQRLAAWCSLRALCDECKGSLAKTDRAQSASKTFVRRGFGNYSEVKIEQWKSNGAISHRTVDFGDIVDKYAAEAGGQLAAVLSRMKEKWP